MKSDTKVNEIHSEDVQDIIGVIPSWVVRNGNSLLVIVLLLLLIAAWFIRYPDTISAPVSITSSTPPIRLIAQANGRITDLHIADGEYVNVDNVIASIDNPAKLKDVLYLKAVVEAIDTVNDVKASIKNITIPENIQVGDLQSQYAVLSQAIDNYNFLVHNGYYKRRIGEILKQKNNNDTIRQHIEKSDQFVADQLKIEKWRDSVYLKLLKDKVISLSEYNDIKKGYLSQSLQMESNENLLVSNKQQEKEFQKSIVDVGQQYNANENFILSTIKEAAKKLKGAIANWESLYLIRAPESGKLIYFNIRKKNQYVRSGTPVFIILPSIDQYEIRVQLPIYKAGKISVGQSVLIKLKEYPFDEFGMLLAKVEEVNKVALDSSYVVHLRLKNGLKTTLNKKIDSIPEMYGSAEIITRDRNLLQRLMTSLYGATN